jgi:hypothetical protein
MTDRFDRSGSAFERLATDRTAGADDPLAALTINAWRQLRLS